MELILWRHADAEMGLTDVKRELTDKGRKQAIRVARWLRPRLDGKWEILVSPADRARQTADALEIDYSVRPALGTSATAEALLHEAGWPANDRNILIVGHQPTLGRVAARLLTGQSGDLGIRKGAVWWFSGKFDRQSGLNESLLRAVVPPDLAD